MTSINLEQEEVEMTAFNQVLDEQISYAKHHLDHIKGLTDGMSEETAKKYTHKAEVQLALIEAVKKAVEYTLPGDGDYSFFTAEDHLKMVTLSVPELTSAVIKSYNDALLGIRKIITKPILFEIEASDV